MTNEFENIQINDIVLTEKQVSFGWGDYKSFYISQKVIKVTKTQFVIESGDRYNKNGHICQSDSWKNAYKLNETYQKFGKTLIRTDETKEMEVFIYKLKLESEIIAYLADLKITTNSLIPIAGLNAIKTKLTEINNVINEYKDK